MQHLFAGCLPVGRTERHGPDKVPARSTSRPGGAAGRSAHRARTLAPGLPGSCGGRADRPRSI